jgi:hypothetical protein
MTAAQIVFPAPGAALIKNLLFDWLSLENQFNDLLIA